MRKESGSCSRHANPCKRRFLQKGRRFYSLLPSPVWKYSTPYKTLNFTWLDSTKPPCIAGLKQGESSRQLQCLGAPNARNSWAIAPWGRSTLSGGIGRSIESLHIRLPQYELYATFLSDSETHHWEIKAMSVPAPNVGTEAAPPAIVFSDEMKAKVRHLFAQ